jgi:hypothetical protein
MITKLRRAAHEGGIGRRERLAVQPDIVFESSSDMAAGGNGSLDEFDLVRTDSRGAPQCSWHQTLGGPNVEVEDLPICRHRILHLIFPSRTISAALNRWLRSNTSISGLTS